MDADLLVDGLRAFRKGSPNMNSLVSFGSIAAFLLSTVSSPSLPLFKQITDIHSVTMNLLICAVIHNLIIFYTGIPDESRACMGSIIF